MDTGQFFSGTIFTPASNSRPLSHTAKGLCIRIGDNSQAAVCYDTELLRVSAGWTGPFLDIDPARFGIIAPTKIAGEIQFSTTSMPGWAKNGSFADTRPFKPYGPLPREHARYQGLFINGNRVAISYSVGQASVTETPWFEIVDAIPIITRTFEVGRSTESLELLVCGDDGVAAIATPTPGISLNHPVAGISTVKIEPGAGTRNFTLAVAAKSKLDEKRLLNLAARLSSPPSMSNIKAPGPIRWTAELTTRGVVGESQGGPFAVDTLTLPFDNPYRALFFVSGHDFLRNNVAAVCTLHGDVWLVSGIDEQLSQIRWQRFATGLFQPLGLKVVNDTIYVVGRDQITRLHDRDGNGEADWYENFNNEGHVSTNGHEYVTCLETDRDGNFYYLKGDSGGKTQHDGCVLRISRDGSRLDVYATGFRNANGMGMGPHDELTVAPQEGEWTPASGIFPVVAGGFHGAMSVHHKEPPPTDYVPPICWLPRRLDNSSGGQVWIPEGNWGPLAGKMLHMSYGQCSLMLVLTEQTAGPSSHHAPRDVSGTRIDDQFRFRPHHAERDGHAGQQGGVIPLPLTFRSGVMRGRFHPRGGHLYISGLRGWVTNAQDDGCFQRVRYVGGESGLPTQVATYSNGLLLQFSEPIETASAEDVDNYRAEQWNYRWSAQYGSPELKPSQPNVEGRDQVMIESATVMDSGKSVFLEIPNLQPVSNFQLDFPLTTARGKNFSRRWVQTIHHVPTKVMPESQLTGRRPSKYLTNEQRKALVPGLLVRFSQRNPVPNSGAANVSDVVRRRMASFSISSDRPAATFLSPGPLQLRAEGFLRAPVAGKYRFRAMGTGTAKIFLKDELIGEYGPSVDRHSKPAWHEVEHDLRGFLPLRVEYEQNNKSERSEFQLLWQDRDGFEEPIPPSAFFCVSVDQELQKAERTRRAAATVIDLRCAKCHAVASAELERATADGPSLKLAGDRLHPDWIAAWLLSPSSLRDDAAMPQLLGNEAQMARQRAAHLAAFVGTLRSPAAATQPNPEWKTDDQKIGEQLWEQLGCIGCHRLTPVKSTDEFQRTSLQFVGRKFRPQALVEYLRHPHADYAATRMPDFRLTEHEARALASFLTAQSKTATLDGAVLPAGDATLGRKLAQELRCQACHDFGAVIPRDQLADGPQRLILNHQKGCLATQRTSGSTAPVFNLNAERRTELVETFATPVLSNWRLCFEEESQRLFAELRCTVCHGRDDRPSLLPTVLAEEGQFGFIPESLPNLTWAGERIDAAWMERFIDGAVRDRPRPHLTTRMPAFHSQASLLAHGLAAQHGIRAVSTSTEDDRANPSKINLVIGYQLTLKDGLDCRQCHPVGNQPAQGDDKTRLAPGINFAVVGDRLRYDFYRRFVLDPPRYDTNTRMPKLSPDGRTTSVQHLYEGDARRQFDAIWDYLQTVHGSEP